MHEQYRALILFSLAYLGMHNLKEIEEMTLAEYEIRTEAYQLQQVDKQRDIAFQSWMNQVAKSTTGSGDNIKAKYEKFDDLFDYDYEKNRVLSLYGDAKPMKSKQEQQKDSYELFAKRVKEWNAKHKK